MLELHCSVTLTPVHRRTSNGEYSALSRGCAGQTAVHGAAAGFHSNAAHCFLG